MPAVIPIAVAGKAVAGGAIKAGAGKALGVGLGKIAGGLATSAGSMGMGMYGSKWAMQQQFEQQKKLMELQEQAQGRLSRENADIQHELAMRMWNDTNAKAQMQHYKDAGLNVGLMYESGGPGATTVNSSAGNISGGNASMPDLGMGVQLGRLALESAQLKANIELTEAQTNKVNTEAEKISSVDTENVKLENIIKDYVGKEAKDVYENVKKPARSEEAKTWSDELGARQAIANNIYEMWASGRLKDKTDAEVEAILINNAKDQKEIEKITEAIKLIKEETQGANIANVINEIEAQWTTGSGFKSGNIADFVTKILGAMISKGIKTK